MARNKYADYSREQLLEKIKQLEKKRFGLVWEDKVEDVAEQCDRQLPVLVHEPKKEITSLPGGPTNLLIEGDNYHALFALNFTHRRKIDVIYIDPPYNTGARNWRYNNDFVDANDRYRHSKWLSMMSKRLRLAKNLLTDSGIICIAIDDYEVPRLTILMEEIFGESNHLGTVPIRNNPSGRSTVRGFSVAHEYALFFSKTDKARIGRLERGQDQVDRYDNEDGEGKFEWVNFRKHGGANANRAARRRLYYPIFANRQGAFRIPDMIWDEKALEWALQEKPRRRETIIYPINAAGEEKTWKRSHLRVAKEPNEFSVRPDRSGQLGVYVKSRMNSSGMLPLTWFDKKEYSSTDYGTNLLTRIFGKSQVFSFPKSLFAVLDCLRVMSSNKNAIVLDFFAGSGTTGQAVLELNKRDGGARRFILCTNNENGIAEEVCYERIRRVIGGSTGFNTAREVIFEIRLTEKVLRDIDSLLEQVDEMRDRYDVPTGGTEIKIEDQFLRLYVVTDGSGDSDRPANLKYFTTDFVPNVLTDKDKRALVERSTELLCIAEDTFELVAASERKGEYAIYRNSKRYTAIIYDEDSVADCVSRLNAVVLRGLVTVYIFSYDHEFSPEEFEEMKVRFRVKPIPEAILNVYRRNASLRKK